ncbi:MULTISPECIES: SUMF1/EgtB/PvdO family nonheme iron enzyme [unclassified Sphingobacterium]|uniref:SUMF1/EgtB/PvdO family nonheme iron enzyme n=1 Tax=unclassified Sphingobacterium TaxID=2609468 RepID=UPI0020C54B2B|nr:MULTISPECIES: SUMF1/EgtB/PvdO family nonheme iron enzyme [unclassified Sphingobacterium]
MFKRNQIIYPLLCMLLLLFSCRRDDGIAIPSEGKELKLVLAKPNSITAMNVATPVEGQEFGVYVLPTGSRDLNSALVNNRKYIYESGELLPADGGAPITYPQDGSAIDVFLYSPYQQVSNGELMMDFTDQLDQAKLDLIDFRMVNVDKNNPIGPISLRHRNSKLKFTLLPGQGLSAEDLGDVEISLVGFSSGWRYKLYLNSIFLLNSSDISLGTQREAIMYESFNVGQEQFRFKVGEKVLEYDLPLYEYFVSGKQYEYQVTINLGSVEVKRVSAMDWQVDAGEIVAYQAPEIEFVPIPAGTFTMGSGATEPGTATSTYPAHQVTLTRDFLMSKYEITLAQYLEFLKDVNADLNESVVQDPNNPSIFWIYNNNFFIKNNGEWKVVPGNENKPVYDVTWAGARAYAQWAGGDLPTEAQWEYAARAGSKADYFFLEDHETLTGHESELAEYAWYDESSGYEIKDVGLLKPNPWGLYDIYGNVIEYCLDEIRTYSINAVVDPGQVAVSNPAIKGGSFLNQDHVANSKFRDLFYLGYNGSNLGFRIIKYPSN